MTLERDAIRSASSDAQTESDERIPISLSSETPVGRWFGLEILDHSSGSVDLRRAAGGLPLLDNHDSTTSVRSQIGVIEDVTLGADRVLRGMARFSRRPEAQAVRQDVLDGIITSTSIGYRVKEMVLEKQSDDEEGDTYRATAWELLEGSFVSVPADASVGAYRSAEAGDARPVRIITPHTEPAPKAKETRMDEQEQTVPAAQAGAASVVASVTDPRAESERAARITELCAMHGMSNRAAEFIRTGRSAGDVAQDILETAARSVKPSATPDVKLSEKEERQYSLVRAINAAASKDWSRAGFEREVSQEIEGKLPQNYERKGGFFMPTSIRAAVSAGTVGAAKEVIFTQPGSFIELLRNAMLVKQMGATVLSGLQGPLAFPKQSAAGSVQWLGESAAVTETNLGTSQVALNPRTIRARQSYTKQLLAQGIVDVENLIRDDLARTVALEIDRAAINGSGAGNEPTGILNTAGVAVVALGANGAAPTYDSMVDLENSIEAANAALGAMGYLTTPEVKAKLKKTAQLANTAALPVWTGGPEGEVGGYKAYASNQVPKTLTKGTSAGICHAILFGAWNQLVIGEWGVLEIQVDPYTRADYGEVVLRTFQMVGLAVRYPESFSVIKDALTA